MHVRRTICALLLTGLTVLLSVTTATATGEAYGSLNGDWPWHVQGLVTHAAMNSPKWQSQHRTIERHIEHLGYLLRNASLAIRAGDRAVAAINIRAALETLDVGVARGFYRRSDVEPLTLIIARQLPDYVRRDGNHFPQEGR